VRVRLAAIMMIAPSTVCGVGVSWKKSSPTAAAPTSSRYTSGASVDASALARAAIVSP